MTILLCYSLFVSGAAHDNGHGVGGRNMYILPFFMINNERVGGHGSAIASLISQFLGINSFFAFGLRSLPILSGLHKFTEEKRFENIESISDGTD